MPTDALYTLGTDPEKDQLAFRRLLLAKQLYQHGYDHSIKEGAINKMISIHNFHNSIELLLKAILLQYEIRQDSTLNIAFDQMLGEIDNHSLFRENNIQLPYRQQLPILNQQRNHVQHHGAEPERSVMEEWRVISRRFLQHAISIFFNLNFDELTPVDFVEDKAIKELLKTSLRMLEENDLENCVIYSKEAFEFSFVALLDLLPRFRRIMSYPGDYDRHSRGNLDRTLRHLEGMSKASLHFSVLLWAGIHPKDYQKYKEITNGVHVHYGDDGSHETNITGDNPIEESSRWLSQFVIDKIVHWQTLGINISTSEWQRKALSSLLGHDVTE